jgi:signal transduction histidine kinase
VSAPALDYVRFRFITGVVFAAIGVAFLFQSMGAWTVNLVFLWPLVLIAFGSAVLLGRAQRLQVEETRTGQLTVAEERVRIARELHDIVAHSVTLMTVQVAAARRVAKTKPDEADHALASAEQTGRQSLAELRRLLAILRSADASIEAASPREAAAGTADDGSVAAPLPGLVDLDRLIDGFRDAGLRVDFEVTGDQPEVSASVGLAIYRVVQEALTNVVRHAGAASAKVSLLYSPEAINVWIEDTGRKPAGPAARAAARPAPGHGLVGMRERIVAAGGVVETGPKADGSGWQVHARVPVIEPLRPVGSAT